MPKRPCPFEADLLPQVKVHVGQKQMNNGVLRDERMKDVYGKIMFVMYVLYKFQFCTHLYIFLFILRNLTIYNF